MRGKISGTLTLYPLPCGGCVVIAETTRCHSEPKAKNLTIPPSYKKQILRLPPQDDIGAQSLEGEEIGKSFGASRDRWMT